MKRYSIAIALMVMALVACAPSPAQRAPGVAEAPRPPEAAQPSRGTGVGALPSMEERRIVRSGNLSLIVQDVAAARDQVADLARNLGGHVVSSNFTGGEHDIYGTITIRVPADKFEQALAGLRSLAVRVASESTTSKDITEEYVDLQSRLKNAEATEQQYLALLSKATDVDSTLKVYERLSQVRQEIEQLKGRIQLLEQTSATSLIMVQLNSAATAGPVVRQGWDVIEELKSAVRGLVVAGQVIGTIAIWLAIFSPIWGSPFLVIAWRRKRKAFKSTGPAAGSADGTKQPPAVQGGRP